MAISRSTVYAILLNAYKERQDKISEKDNTLIKLMAERYCSGYDSGRRSGLRSTKEIRSEVI